MSVAPQRTRFGTDLRKHLDQRGMSLRALARALNQSQPEVARRNLARWIGGYNEPSRLNRIAVARALGLPDETFLDEDDEEADPVVDLVNAVRDLVDELKAAR